MGHNKVSEMKQANYSFELQYLSKHHEPFDMKKAHYHDSYEIHYLLDGERNLLLKNQIYHFRKGDLLFIKSNDMHRMTISNNSVHERFQIEFKPFFLHSLKNSLELISIEEILEMESILISLTSSEQQYVESTIIQIYKENMQKQIEAQSLIRYKLMELLIFIYRKACLAKQKERVYDSSNVISNNFIDIIRHINENYSKNISLSDIENQFFVSKSYFCKNFKRITGMTFIQYLNEFRVKQAKKLLKKGEVSISKTAELCGFDSITHFGRVFRSITSMTATQFKKNM